jgi:spore coat protein U-like protein
VREDDEELRPRGRRLVAARGRGGGAGAGRLHDHDDSFSATPEDATGTIQIDCNPRENIQVTLSKGSSSTYTTRTLKNGTNALNYNLYRDSARTQIWGDGTGGSSIQSNNNVRTRTYTTYGRAPAAQDASVGAYSDTIIVTVIF